MTTTSKLSQARLAAGLTQDDMAELTGLARSTYWRLEHGAIENPPYRHLGNCAYVLGVHLEELVEDEWCEWLQLPGGPPDAPRPKDVEKRRGPFAVA